MTLGSIELGDDESGPDDGEDVNGSDDGEDSDGWGNKALIGGGITAATVGSVCCSRDASAPSRRCVRAWWRSCPPDSPVLVDHAIVSFSLMGVESAIPHRVAPR